MTRLGPAPLPLVAVSFLSSLGFSFVMPFLVFLVTDLGGNAFAMGAIGASFSLSQLVGAPWLGALSDRIGRKPVLFYSQIGGLLAWGIFAAALVAPRIVIAHVDSAVTGSFVVLLPLVLIMVSRASDGLFNGSISVANAYLADVTTDDDRKAAFARLGAATSLGFVVGPLAAGYLARGEAGVMRLVLLAAALSAAGAFVVRRYLPDVEPSRVEPAVVAVHVASHKALGGGSKECVARCAPTPARTLLRADGARLMIALYFLVFLGYSVFAMVLPMHAVVELGWSSARLGQLFGVLSLTLILTQAIVLPPLSRRVADAWLGAVGSALVATAYVVVAALGAPGAFAGAAMYGVGNGLMWPSYLSMLSRTGSPAIRGRLQGVAGSAGSVASVAGMLGGGSAFGALGGRTFLLAAAALAVATAMFVASARAPAIEAKRAAV